MIVEPRGSKQYPALAALLDGWFHQDYDIYGDSLEAILPHYVKVTPHPERLQVVKDITRFEDEYGETDEKLRTRFEAIFDPGVTVEHWDGMTTRQWLERVRELIR